MRFLDFARNDKGKTRFMKIAISGSMAFAKDMVKVKKELEALGHTVFVPYDVEVHMARPDFVDDLTSNLSYAMEADVMRKHLDIVAQSDAIFVLNLERKGMKGYIGASTLIELGLAYYLKKKLFLYQDIPHWDEARWAHEVTIMRPTIVHGNLYRVK